MKFATLAVCVLALALSAGVRAQDAAPPVDLAAAVDDITMGAQMAAVALQADQMAIDAATAPSAANEPVAIPPITEADAPNAQSFTNGRCTGTGRFSGSGTFKGAIHTVPLFSLTGVHTLAHCRPWHVQPVKRRMKVKRIDIGK